MDNIKIVIGKNLANLRKESSYTQYEIAQKLGYTDKSISKWETGETLPDIETLCKLCEIYKVSLDYLTSEESLEEKEKYRKTSNPSFYKSRRISITALCTSFVWILATIIYVYLLLLSNINYWLVFLWALPASFLCLDIFNLMWGNKLYSTIVLSGLVWTLVLCFYLQFIQYNPWPIFLLCLPIQVSLILWYQTRKDEPRKS